MGKRSVLSFEDATAANEMATLGDMMIGTTPPLVWRLRADQSKARDVDKAGRVEFTIGGSELYCNGKKIESRLEQNIAWYLLLYGDWRQEEAPAHISDSRLEYVDFILRPEQESDQGFEIIGSLSSMFSSFYVQTTSEEKRVKRLLVRASDRWGGLIPDDYKGDALPLWRFTLKPNFEGIQRD